MMRKLADYSSWLAIALVCLALALFLQPWRPDWTGYARYLAVAGLILLLLSMLTGWREIAAAFQRRQTRLSTITFSSIAFVLGILVLINIIGARQSKRWDLTVNNVYTLSDQTQNVLRKLDAPLAIRVFEKAMDLRRFKDQLTEYEHASKNVTVEYVDADKQRTRAIQYKVETYGTVVFEYKGRVERVSGSSEQDLTTGIVKVVTGSQKKIYLTQGHGEKIPDSTERTGFSTVKSSLERENYGVDKVVLIQQGRVPADAAALIVAGPKTDLLAPEVDAIRRYLAGGGKLMVMLDPPESSKAAPLANLEGLLREWGFDVGNNIVVDASGLGQIFGADAATPVAASYPTHPITEKMNLMTAYPFARSIGPLKGGANGHTPDTFIQTSSRSWGESDIDGLMKSGEVKFDEGKDLKGPVSIGAAVSAAASAAAKTPESAGADKNEKTSETRVVAIGDSDFAANAYINVQGNRDLFMNTIGWLSQQENLISIRPREASDRRLTMTAAETRLVFFMAIFGIPGAILAMGVYTWWRRR
ncbi:MAG: Gldg family protein [Acidobacteria bacterium]|nr:Gldg family protein [Acidobacteriota bacterium]